MWDSRARIRVVVAGRRFGKTWLAAALAIRCAIERPGALIWWVAPTFTLARKGWRVITGDLLRDVPGIKRHVKEEYIEFPNGATIWIKSADRPETLVSEGLDLLVVDEAARVSEIAWEESLRPTLLDRQGYAVFISTPKGKNWFYHLWLDARKPENPHMEAWRFRSEQATHISKAWVEHERAKCTIQRLFEQEYEAEFIEAVGSVFRNIRGCIDGKLELPDQHNPQPVVFGIDWGKRQDATVFCIMDVTRKHLVDFHRLLHLGYEEQIQKVKALVARWCPLAIVAEENSVGDPLVERLETEVGERTIIEPVLLTSTRKADLVENLVLAIENRTITYPNVEQLIDELEAFRYEQSPTGRVRYSAPEGERFSDDAVLALGYAYYGTQNYFAPAPEPEPLPKDSVGAMIDEIIAQSEGAGEYVRPWHYV